MAANSCIIYSSGKISVDELRNELSIFLHGKKVGLSFIETNTYEVSVYENDGYDVIMESEFPDGFLYFHFIIEVGFSETIELNECIKVISALLEWLWQREFSAVAACNYEDLLPNNGGYGSNNIPWPTAEK